MASSQNSKAFSEIVQKDFGRKIIYVNAETVDSSNIVELLSEGLSTHETNVTAIEYLERYYKGDQPILYREKTIRPEVNNKIVINLAYELVERKVADICAEPIQYVLRGVDEKKTEEVTFLNTMMDVEDKQSVDIDICRWRSICGTGYRWIERDIEQDEMDECSFSLHSCDPKETFVAYFPTGKPAYSCQIRQDEDGNDVYYVYTKGEQFTISGDSIIESNINGNGNIPVIEYPNNSRRLSDIEITISIMDAINTLSSDRINGIEQFVSSWVKFVNCEVDAENFLAMRQEGALVVKSNNGSDNKADVDIMTQELNQSQSQIVFDDLFTEFLEINGLASREGNTGGDTQGAVNLRNGHYDASLRTAINEPILRKSENMALKVILYMLKVDNGGFSLMPSDIEIHINHNKLDNMLVKAETASMLLTAGYHYKEVTKLIDLFGDPDRVSDMSKDRMEILYPTTEEVTNEETGTEETEENTIV